MIYIEALEEYYPYDHGYPPSVFLAGGITGCPDWQAEVTELLADTDFAVINPRRANFPIDDLSAARAQIEWEWRHLHKANRILFWFPNSPTSVCPIALYELGAWSMADKRIAIGCEPGYSRTEDVVIQTELARGDLIRVHHNLYDLVEDIR